MLARIRHCVIWNILCLFCLIPANGADKKAATPYLGECEERKRELMEVRLGSTMMNVIEGLPANWDTEEVAINLLQIEFSHMLAEETMLTYGCEPAKVGRFTPGYSGFAWAVSMPITTTFSLIHPRDHRITDTTIRSYLDEESADSSNDVDALRMLVSGPFWRLGRSGEVPIGALVSKGVKRQDFRPNFSARYVLCSTPDMGLDLTTGSARMFEGPQARKCDAAIQVGPAQFEPPDPSANDENAKLGIGANSMNRSRRNVLIKVKASARNGTPKGSLILLSTLFDIASYDAMIASELVVRKLSGDGRIVWAVGLVDDESLSGPVLTIRGRPALELVEANRPTGAIMQFIFNGG